jgi:hypothetical protein
MLRMIDITTVSIAIASAGVLIAAVYYALQIRHQTRIRKTDMLIRLYQTYSGKEFADAEFDILGLEFKDLKNFREKYGSLSPDSENRRTMGKSMSLVLGFYELVGTLLYRKYVDLVLVNDIFSFADVKSIYEKVKPLIVGLRKEKNNPFENAGLEYLYNELLRKRSKLMKSWAKALLQPISNTNSSN